MAHVRKQHFSKPNRHCRRSIKVARLRNARLEVIGDGSELPRLRQLAVTLRIADRVTFHGFMSDPRSVLGNIDVVVSASRSESLGLSLLEAQAMGRAVITFGVGGTPEVVADGITGWVLRDHTATALAERMEFASNAVACTREMGVAARRYVDREHGIDRMCAGYGDVYEQLSAR